MTLDSTRPRQRDAVGRSTLVTVVALAAVASLPAVGSHLAAQDAPRDTAVFAGGCFWCMEEALDKVEGVISTTSGFAGGDVPNPSYEQVVRGGTGHREAVQAVFDPSVVGYAEILPHFWRNVDPFDGEGQFCDRGFSYTAAIFAADDTQARQAAASKDHVQRLLGRQVVTPVVTGADFYPAEEYHQDYYEKNPVRYRLYKWNCGREQRLEDVWGDVADSGSDRSGAG